VFRLHAIALSQHEVFPAKFSHALKFFGFRWTRRDGTLSGTAIFEFPLIGGKVFGLGSRPREDIFVQPSILNSGRVGSLGQSGLVGKGKNFSLSWEQIQQGEMLSIARDREKEFFFVFPTRDRLHFETVTTSGWVLASTTGFSFSLLFEMADTTN